MVRSGGKALPVWAVIVAGGAGVRMGSPKPKQYLPIGGVPIIRWTVTAFQSSPVVDHIVVVVPAADRGMVEDEILDRGCAGKLRDVVAGGATRQDSTAAGVSEVGDAECVILVHDGVRPFTNQDAITAAAETAAESGAALVAMPITDTVKRVGEDGVVTETVPRTGLWAAQTPQAFRAEILREALDKAKQSSFVGTDESQLVERAGYSVRVVQGDCTNIKITTPEDLERAEIIASGRDLPC